MQAAYESFGCNQGNVFFLGIDKGNTNTAVIQFDTTYGIQYPSVSGNQGNGNAVHWDYNIQATPTVIVINPDRSIAVKQIYPPSTTNVVDSVLEAGGILQDCLTGLNGNPFEKIKLYPNPVSDFLSISINETLRIESIQIFDLTGRVIQNLEIIGNTGNKWVINTINFPSGFYFTEVKIIGRKKQVRKFIKK